LTEEQRAKFGWVRSLANSMEASGKATSARQHQRPPIIDRSYFVLG